MPPTEEWVTPGGVAYKVRDDGFAGFALRRERVNPTLTRAFASFAEFAGVVCGSRVSSHRHQLEGLFGRGVLGGRHPAVLDQDVEHLAGSARAEDSR